MSRISGLQWDVVQFVTKESKIDTTQVVIVVDGNNTLPNVDIAARCIGLSAAAAHRGNIRMMVTRAWLPLDWKSLMACAVVM